MKDLRKFIATTIREYLNENVNNITFKKSVDEDIEGQLLAFSKFLLNRSYVRGKYYPETLVKLFKSK